MSASGLGGSFGDAVRGGAVSEAPLRADQTITNLTNQLNALLATQAAGGVVDPNEVAALREQLDVLGAGVISPSITAQIDAAIASLDKAFPEAEKASEGGGSAAALVTNALRQIGLESEIGWALGMLRLNVSPDEVLLQLRERPAYKQRFRANEERRAKGLPQLSEGAIIQFESGARELMRRANLPGGFWDSTDDFVTFLANDWSLAEIGTRINDGYAKVAQNPEVRSAFQRYFGANGDGALAAWFLDPTKAEPVLMEQVTAATFGGVGQRFGYDIGLASATRAAQAGVGAEAAQQGFEQLGQMRPLFTETITENNDLTAEGAGVGAVFGLDATSAEEIRRRQQSRQAAFGGGGGAAFTNQGIAGFGEAR